MPTKRGACNPNKGHAQRCPPRRHAPQCCLPRRCPPRRCLPRRCPPRRLRGHQPGPSRASPSSARPRPPRRHSSGGSRLSPSSAAWQPPRVRSSRRSAHHGAPWVRSSRRSAAIGPAAAAQPGIGGDVVSRGWERDCPLRDSLGYYYEHKQSQVAGLECHRPSRICRRPKARVQSQNETTTTKLGGGSNSVPNRDDHCRRSPLSSGAAANSEKRGGFLYLSPLTRTPFQDMFRLIFVMTVSHVSNAHQ
jgi:hypothetical protein